jgi:enterochelin esterase family protein
VRLFSAPSGDHDDLVRLGADIWFASYVAPWDTRLSYRLAPDVPDLPGSARERRVAVLATAAADPLNAHPWPADAPDPFNAWSSVTLRDAPAQPGCGPRPDARGTLKTTRFASAALGNTRAITFYTPAGFDPDARDNVLLLLFDAEQWLTKGETPRALDALIAAGDLPHVAAAFISPVDQRTRGRELPGNPVFADALADEVLPLALGHFGMAHDPARTVLAGASYGGLAAVYGALRRPDAFGAAISLSGSFWHAPEGTPPDRLFIPELALSMPTVDVRFHLTAGLFEGAHGGARGILETTRHLRDVLRAKGYDVGWRDYAAGHDHLVWRGALGDGLLALFAP